LDVLIALAEVIIRSFQIVGTDLGTGTMGRLIDRFITRAAIELLIGTGMLFFGHPSVFAGQDFPNGFPADSSFFPIGVWLQSPYRAPAYKQLGINTFVGLFQGPTENQLAILAKYNMFAVANQNEVALKSTNNHVIRGWLDFDEPDNAQPIGAGQYGTCIPAEQVALRSREMRANDPTRPIAVGFGQGIADEAWIGRGPCTGDMKYYNIAAQGADILSFDIYPVGSTAPQVKGKLQYVARGVTNLSKIASSGQVVWDAIEASALDPKRPVTPEEVRTEVWMSLIHGSRGIIYFVHEFAPFREDGIFGHPLVAEEVKKINLKIKALAPVINSASVSGKLTVSSTAPIATMVKQYENHLYIFAVAMRNEAANARFVIEDLKEGEAQIIDENRSVTISGGSFGDSFSAYGVHIYKVSLGKNN
jgi:hypothetical protein